MKRSAIVLAGALTLMAGSALAAMGPDFGLPQGWTMTPGAGYGNLTVNGNRGSAMCVECHTVNPSRRVVQVMKGGAGAFTPLAANAVDQGSHFVMNQQAGAANAPWGITHSGGGFTGGYGGAARVGGQYYRNLAWVASTGESKYNVGTTLNSQYEITNAVPDGTSDIICESCHNLVKNTANAAADNDLLLGYYEDNKDDRICTGCHAQSEVAAGRQAFHGNDNLPSFSGTTVRKRHHVMTGDLLTDTYYGSTGVSSTMWAPSFSNRLATNWCISKYANPPVGLTEIDLTAGAAIAFRGLCNPGGSGSFALANVTIGDITPTAANAVNCSNCHRPHNARSASGAFILRMGDPGKSDFVGEVGTAKFTGLTNASLYYGIRRQYDVDPSYAKKVYQEYRPLCAGCHYGY